MGLLHDFFAKPTSEHWDFPIAFSAAGERMIVLRQLVQSRPPITAPAELSSDQWRALVVARLRAHRVFQFATPTALVRTPAAAIDAIEKNSEVGQWIIAEQREVVTRLVNEVVNGEEMPINAV